jgi:nitrite reductase/ring-hydroxylating ferredoxin subunit
LNQAAAGVTEDLPVLGYRNYWYPVIEARRVKRKAVSVRILGEDIVLFPGKDGRVAALADRCPHRGVKLCRGRTLFPGTISCGYHGWTFDERGNCVAALVEGPESRVPGKVTVRAYPTEIRHGIVWAFLGKGKPPPIEDDLPQELFRPDCSFQFLFEEWNCDWRNVTENYPDMLHALFVHRNSFEMIFQKIPAWGRMVVKPLPDGKGISVQGPGAAMQADYPGLGRYPRRAWWRVLTRRTPAGVGAEVRMPGYIVLSQRREPYFGFFFTGWQWPIPVDEHRTRILEATITYPRNVLSGFGYRLWWNLYYKWVHRWAFTYQDERQIGVQNYRKFETVCSTDVGITLWRRLARQSARQASDRAKPWNGHDQREERESI